jgi:hypothetical protein
MTETGQLRAIVILLTFSLTGCVPFQVPDTPRMTVLVVDSVTRIPLSGVEVSARGKVHPEALSKAKSGPDGVVLLPPLSHTVWLPPLPYDFFMQGGRVRFEATGYQSEEFDMGDVLRAESNQEPIEMQPIAANPSGD